MFKQDGRAASPVVAVRVPPTLGPRRRTLFLFGRGRCAGVGRSFVLASRRGPPAARLRSLVRRRGLRRLRPRGRRLGFRRWPRVRRPPPRVSSCAPCPSLRRWSPPRAEGRLFAPALRASLTPHGAHAPSWFFVGPLVRPLYPRRLLRPPFSMPSGPVRRPLLLPNAPRSSVVLCGIP